MMWFKRLFRRSCRETEAPKERLVNSEMWSRIVDFESNEVFALTTVRNFHCDPHDAHVYESEWVLVSREKLMEAKFQERLRKPSDITTMCQKLAKTSKRKIANIVAKSPSCHCDELKYLNKKSRCNIFRRFVKRAKNLFVRVCKKIKCLFTMKYLNEEEYTRKRISSYIGK